MTVGSNCWILKPKNSCLVQINIFAFFVVWELECELWHLCWIIKVSYWSSSFCMTEIFFCLLILRNVCAVCFQKAYNRAVKRFDHELYFFDVNGDVMDAPVEHEELDKLEANGNWFDSHILLLRKKTPFLLYKIMKCKSMSQQTGLFYYIRRKFCFIKRLALRAVCNL